MDKVNIATILVAVIAAIGAWSSQREARKAALQNTQVSGRVDMEKEAYDRARAFDTETIARQNKEIEELRKDHEACAGEISSMKAKYEAEIQMLRARIARLERDTVHNIEEILRERLRDDTGGDAAVQQ